jgi:hypothetical protein
MRCSRLLKKLPGACEDEDKEDEDKEEEDKEEEDKEEEDKEEEGEDKGEEEEHMHLRATLDTLDRRAARVRITCCIVSCICV